jgi:hypothetical protein
MTEIIGHPADRRKQTGRRRPPIDCAGHMRHAAAMKQYPPVPRATGQAFAEFQAVVFDKIDGSNLRFLWSPKAGWHRFGTRHRLFDASDPDFGEAIAVFEATLAEPLARIARRERWQELVAYAEFWGPSSFAGVHAAEPHMLSLIDLDVYKRGLLPPSEYAKMTEGLPRAEVLGHMRWTRGLVERVRAGDLPGITFEGVVAKGVERGRQGPVMAKAKTQAWIDAVRARYAAADAARIIDS